MKLKKAAAGLLLAAFSVAAAGTLPAAAQQPAPAARTATAQTDAMKYATGTYLAYVKSVSGLANNTAQKGLEVLSNALSERTTIAPSGVAALDIERDDISLFRFIYWPVTKDAPALSKQAQQKVQNFINSGGLIVFDIQNGTKATDNPDTLRRVLGDVGFNPLVPMEKDYTLAQTFYLTAGLPGSGSFGDPVWVEAPGASGKQGVTSIVLGDSNWAGAWAGQTLALESRERELALRAGVNMVMFALTGSYKTDAVHQQAILERLKK